jgi:PAS domain-containing protein
MTGLQDYAVIELDRSVADAKTIGAAARSNVRSAVVLAAALTLLTLLLLALTVRAIIVPLRRLTATALRLGSGDLPTTAVRVSGPSDLRVMTRTFNDMVAVIANFDAKMRALANGDLDDPALTGELPGAMGETLRSSITRLTSVTARLKESEALASAIVDTAADAIWTIDHDGRIVSANASAVLLMGVDEPDQLGLVLARFVDTEAGESEIHRPDGEVVSVLVSTSVVTAEPEPIYTVFASSSRTSWPNKLATTA